MQNFPAARRPFCAGAIMADDQFGGPGPDDAHLTGVILRLNADGTTPSDNPFVESRERRMPSGPRSAPTSRRSSPTASATASAWTFDPVGGDALGAGERRRRLRRDQPRRAPASTAAGSSHGAGSRVAEFKAIEVARGNSLQQNRWPPPFIADTPEEALARIFQSSLVPARTTPSPSSVGSTPSRPRPSASRASGLGLQYARRPLRRRVAHDLLGGYLMRFKLDARPQAVRLQRLAPRRQGRRQRLQVRPLREREPCRRPATSA